MRMSIYGAEAISTVECLEHFVKTCNDHALHLIKKNEFRIATEILHQCEYVLLSPIGQNFPQFKYQTFNNLAHCHNVQANVRLSIKYLLRALEYAQHIVGVDQPSQQKGSQIVTLVESYLNTCNAYSFLNQNEQALDYAEKAILLSHKLINDLIKLLDNPSLNADLRDYYGEQYHQQINLHAMSFHTKGQIYEKLKQYEEAIIEYKSGKQVIEANYGSSHKLYVDFANSINGAKLRIKYYMHSNLPNNESQQPAERRSSIKEANRQSLNGSNLFLIEQEKIKPISQQKGLKKLRPSSAKQVFTQKNYDSDSSKNFKQEGRQSNRSTLDLQSQRLPPSASISKIKNRPIKRMNFHASMDQKFPKDTPPLSNRSTSSSNKDQKYFSYQKQKLETKLRNFQHNSHSKSSSHNHQCQDCQTQLHEIRQLQIEQQKLMNMMLQQQYNQQTNQQQTQGSNQSSPNQNQFFSQTSTQQVPPFNPQLHASGSFQMMPQQMMAPPPMYAPYYYPYPQAPFPPPYGYMGGPPPAPYGYYQGGHTNSFQSGIFLPPQRPSPYQPSSMMNNYMQNPNDIQNRGSPDLQREGGDQSSEHNHHQPQFGWDQLQNTAGDQSQFKSATKEQRNYPTIPQFYPKQQQTEEKQQQSVYTDLNERDSQFGEDFENELRDTKRSNNAPAFRIKTVSQPTSQSQRSSQQQLQHQYPQKGQQLNKENIKPSQKNDHKNVMEKMKIAAIKIQKYYRRYQTQKMFRGMLNQRRQKFQFHRQIYVYKTANGKQQRCLLIPSLITVRKQIQNGQMKQVPQMISLEIYDYLNKKILFESTLKVSLFGFPNMETVTNVEIFNRVKNILSKLHFTGNPQHDLIKQLESLIHQYSKEKFQQNIIFIEPQYFTEGLQQMKDIKVELKHKSEQDEEFNESIDESIQDQYSNKSFSEDKHEKSASIHKSLSLSQSLDQIPIPQKVEVLQQPLNDQTEDDYEDDINEQFEEESLHDDSHKSQSSKSSKSSKKSVKQKSLSSPSHSEKPSFEEEELSPEQLHAEVVKDESISSSHHSLILDSPKSSHKSEQSSGVKDSKPLTYTKAQQEKAALLIQSRARAFLARKDLDIKKKKKSKLCQFVLKDLTSTSNCAQVTLTEKYKKKKNLSTFQLVVKNLNKKHKKNSHKIKLEKLPIYEQYIKEYLIQALEIIWQKDQIDRININQNRVPMDTIMKSQNIEMHLSNNQVIQQQVIEDIPQISDKLSRKSSSKSIDSDDKHKVKKDKKKNKKEKKDKKEKKEKKEKKSKKDKKEKKDKKDKKDKKEKKPKKEQEQKLIKAQAYVRGFLVRNQMRLKQVNTDGFKMLARICRKLSDEKLYYIFLMSKSFEQITSSEDTFYLITLREVENINEIYDLEISLDMAKKIFGRKNCSTAQLNQLVMYETNRQEFIKMLECLDIIDEEFSLDFKKFRAFQINNPILNMVNSLPEDHQMNQFQKILNQPVHNSANNKIVSPSNRSNSSNSSFKEEIIEEADSRFEVSPSQHHSTKQLQPPIKQKMPPVQAQNKKGNKLKPIDLKTLAIIKIQSYARRYLSMKKLEASQAPTFKNKSRDKAKHLKLYKSGLIKAAGLYFIYYLYTDTYKEFVKLTLKEMSKKVTIISLKKIVLADFGDQGAELDDIPDYITDNIQEYGNDILIDPKSKKLKSDWIAQMHEFIENNL